MDGFGIFAIFSFLFIIAIFALVIVVYVYNAKWHVKIFEYLEYSNPWLGWIPFACQYALSDIACEAEGATIFGTHFDKKLFNFWYVITTGIGMIPAIGSIASLVLNIVCGGYCYARIYAKIYEGTPEQYDTEGKLAGFIPIIAAMKFKKFYS